MFARTFAVRAKDLDFGNPEAVLSFMGESLCKEAVGREPIKFSLFVDADAEHKKVVFYDVSILESVIEFSSIFGRTPEYSVESDGEKFRLYHFHPDRSVARVYDMAFFEKDGRREIASIAPDPGASEKESRDLKIIVSSTDGLLKAAEDITGKVVCQVVQNEETQEKRPFFALKLDVRHEKYRAILRSCQKMHFAWSEDVSYMVLICRFKMMPAFALAIPVTGKALREAMELYMQTDRAVGMVMYVDDVSDAFTIEKGEPVFENAQKKEGE